MGMMKWFSGWLKGADQDVWAPELREAEPARAASHAPRLPVAVTVPFSAPSPPAFSSPRAETERETTPKAAGVKKVMLDEKGISVLDLRELPSSRFRIVGSAYWVSMAGREKHGDTEYLLVREPKNNWDKSAVAVYGKGRKVGHLSEKKAAAYAPILDAFDFDAFTVGGASVSVNSSQLWVDLPSLPALRAFTKAHEKLQAAARTSADA